MKNWVTVSRLCKLLSWWLTLVHAFIASHVDLFNSFSLPDTAISKIHTVRNTWAKYLIGAIRFDSATHRGFSAGCSFLVLSLVSIFFSVSSCIFIHMIYEYGTINQHLFYWLISLGSISLSHWVALSSFQYWPLHPGRLRYSSIEWLQIRYYFLYENSPKGNIKLPIKLLTQ